MRRARLALFGLALLGSALVAPAGLRAQGADPAAGEGPLLRADFPETEAIPGQPLRLRLTVLVPTFMPKPPVWPSFEAPNLLVRLPSRATNPTSETIGGESWSGLTRTYLIAPMAPGRFEIPPQEVVVTWSDSGSGEATRVVLRTEPLAFAGTLPAGAEGLDPFLAAKDVSLKQEIEGAPEAMKPGDSLTREVSAEIDGASPMFLPRLLPVGAELPGLAAYPAEPALDEAGTGGARTERVAYVAEGGGEGSLPALSLDWWDLDENVVKTARLDAVAYRVEGPPARRAAPLDWRRAALVAAAAAALLALLALALRRALPPLRRRAASRRAARRASEPFAWRALERVVSRRDHAALRPALDRWAARVEGDDPRRDGAVSGALLTLGAARYGPGAHAPAGAEAWRTLGRALAAARRAGAPPAEAGALPPLNPGGAR